MIKIMAIANAIRLVINGGLAEESIDITEVPDFLRSIADEYEKEIKKEQEE